MPWPETLRVDPSGARPAVPIVAQRPNGRRRAERRLSRSFRSARHALHPQLDRSAAISPTTPRGLGDPRPRQRSDRPIARSGSAPPNRRCRVWSSGKSSDRSTRRSWRVCGSDTRITCASSLGPGYRTCGALRHRRLRRPCQPALHPATRSHHPAARLLVYQRLSRRVLPQPRNAAQVLYQSSTSARLLGRVGRVHCKGEVYSPMRRPRSQPLRSLHQGGGAPSRSARCVRSRRSVRTTAPPASKSGRGTDSGVALWIVRRETACATASEALRPGTRRGRSYRELMRGEAASVRGVALTDGPGRDDRVHL
jgi:hypothetical protein